VDDILAADSGGPDMALTSLPAIAALWPALEAGEGVAAVCKAALIWSLKHVVVQDSGRFSKKWQAAQIAPGEPLARSWPEFCVVHLAMDAGTVSAYDRIWEVYHVALGYGMEDMVKAGVFRLKAAGPLLERLWKEDVVEERLTRALFGAEDVCAGCGGYVSQATATCPHCGDAFKPVPVASRRELVGVVKAVRDEYFPGSRSDAPDLDVLASVEYEYDEVEDDGLRVKVYRVLADAKLEGVTSALPPWEVPVIADDAPEGALGIRSSHQDAFRRWLHKFPGMG